ncbi:unnamed protein product [Closterium sp. NIES-53]
MSEPLRATSSTQREIEGVLWALQTYANKIKQKHVLMRVDNQGVFFILRKGGCRSPDLTTACKSIIRTCMELGTRLIIEWIPHELNSHTDELSKMVDHDDYALKTPWFRILERRWGPHSIDLFVNSRNTQLSRFCTKIPHPEAIAVHTFSIAWTSENNFAFPPPQLVPVVCGAPFVISHSYIFPVRPARPTALLPYAPRAPCCPARPAALAAATTALAAATTALAVAATALAAAATALAAAATAPAAAATALAAAATALAAAATALAVAATALAVAATALPAAATALDAAATALAVAATALPAALRATRALLSCALRAPCSPACHACPTILCAPCALLPSARASAAPCTAPTPPPPPPSPPSPCCTPAAAFATSPHLLSSHGPSSSSLALSFFRCAG